MNEDAPLHLASAEEMAGIVAQETAELERRERVYRGERPQPDLHGRTVILVDDGLATGSSMRAAIAAARQRGAGRVVVAVPVGPEHTRAAIRAEADDVICVLCPEIFYSVGEWYRHFDQTSDDDVTRLLDAAWTRGV
jgi:predicted phosphoribosyltransferase